jgi:hypothetical protein
MNAVLATELTGPPITVQLGGQEYPLAYPMFAVILYRQETARLNRARGLARVQAGVLANVPRLTPAELREARERYFALIAEAQGLKGEAFQRLMEEATLVKLPVDEATGAGDSLCLMHNWWRISLDDPERVLLALWAGLHQQSPPDAAGKTVWKAPFTLAQLEAGDLGGISIGNLDTFLPVITKALLAWIKREDAPKNAAAPEAAAPAKAEEVAKKPRLASSEKATSAGSGPQPVSISG